MHAYVYQWSLRPRPDIRVELQIEAQSACVARRELVAFLREHEAESWRVETVSRSHGTTLVTGTELGSRGDPVAS